MSIIILSAWAAWTIAGQPADALSPIAWSPDSRHIAYVRFGWDPTGKNWELAVADVLSSTARILRADAQPLSGPAWAPDGRHLALQKLVLADNTYLFQTLIVAVDDGRPAAGFTTQPLAGRPTDPAHLVREAPQYSPDGRALLVPWVREAQTGYSVVDLAAPRAVRHLEPCLGAAWSPDGRQVAFFRPDGDGWVLVVADVAAGRLTRLGPLRPRLVQRPGWLADGTRLVAPEAWSDPNGRPGLTLRAWSLPEGQAQVLCQEPVGRAVSACVVAPDLHIGAALVQEPGPTGSLTHLAILDPSACQWLHKVELPAFSSEAIPVGGLSLSPDGCHAAVRVPLEHGQSVVGLVEVHTGRFRLLLTDWDHRLAVGRAAWGRCRRLLGMAVEAPLLATPSVARLADLPQPSKPLLMSLAQTGRQSLGDATDSQAPVEALILAAQFELMLGDAPGAWQLLQHLRQRQPSLSDDPRLLLFQARAFFLMRDYPSAVAAARLALIRLGPADAALRREIQELADLAVRSRR